ncbi:uncharacterized protein STEHIDRAFT_155082 [Stereum hirsutum FP-91666 SS1]|uniref:uncharacterized protein n=1 Tax=Stereum hirsutum (strain FP-91666) TaxID=721885 RepID=UPI000440CADD|nr:uncharacterized protein STEHIDRAFT_155082 [Stereum hirsutum FP-91666 SS1]EIM89420.1 hypothetical protein STEHIDRAFT_155082 [Stereum hirsutum FP-91666 SS1]
MQFSNAFFALASALLLVVPASAATLKADIACTPLAACNGNNHYDVGHSCKYYISSCTGSIIEGKCVATDSGLQCQ